MTGPPTPGRASSIGQPLSPQQSASIRAASRRLRLLPKARLPSPKELLPPLLAVLPPALLPVRTESKLQCVCGRLPERASAAAEHCERSEAALPSSKERPTALLLQPPSMELRPPWLLVRSRDDRLEESPPPDIDMLTAEVLSGAADAAEAPNAERQLPGHALCASATAAEAASATEPADGRRASGSPAASGVAGCCVPALLEAPESEETAARLPLENVRPPLENVRPTRAVGDVEPHWCDMGNERFSAARTGLSASSAAMLEARAPLPVVLRRKRPASRTSGCSGTGGGAECCLGTGGCCCLWLLLLLLTASRASCTILQGAVNIP